jgi:hypothetical protein
MLSSSQVQLSNQSCASNISTTTFINNHTTYLIFLRDIHYERYSPFIDQHLFH